MVSFLVLLVLVVLTRSNGAKTTFVIFKFQQLWFGISEIFGKGEKGKIYDIFGIEENIICFKIPNKSLKNG